MLSGTTKNVPFTQDFIKNSQMTRKKAFMVLIIPLISPGNRLNEPNLFSINFLSRTHFLLQSSTMVYVLRRHVRENDPDKPVDHYEEDGGER